MAKILISMEIAVLIALALACDRDESVHAYQAPKESSNSTSVTTNATPWKLPAGWERQPDQPMRVATFRAGDAEVLITKFGAQSFASLLPNINRWRSQVGLPPVGEDEVGKSTRELEVGGIKATVVDLVGPGGGGRRPARTAPG